MNIHYSVRTGHSSREGACCATFLLQSPRRPQLATRKGALSLTGTCTSRSRDGVETPLFSQENGGPHIAVGEMIPWEGTSRPE